VLLLSYMSLFEYQSSSAAGVGLDGVPKRPAAPAAAPSVDIAGAPSAAARRPAERTGAHASPGMRAQSTPASASAAQRAAADAAAIQHAQHTAACVEQLALAREQLDLQQAETAAVQARLWEALEENSRLLTRTKQLECEVVMLEEAARAAQEAARAAQGDVRAAQGDAAAARAELKSVREQRQALKSPPGDSAASTHAALQRAREEVRHLTSLLSSCRCQDRAMPPGDVVLGHDQQQHQSLPVRFPGQKNALAEVGAVDRERGIATGNAKATQIGEQTRAQPAYAAPPIFGLADEICSDATELDRSNVVAGIGGACNYTTVTPTVDDVWQVRSAWGAEPGGASNHIPHSDGTGFAVRPVHGVWQHDDHHILQSRFGDVDWADALISSFQPAFHSNQGGFVGLIITSAPPHRVKRVKDLLDQNYIRHDQHGYRNPPIAEDDRILQVDGVEAEHVDVDTLHRMLAGPLHSIAVLTLARRSTGEVYRVEALRHGEHAFDHSLGPGMHRGALGFAAGETDIDTRPPTKVHQASATIIANVHAAVTVNGTGHEPDDGKSSPRAGGVQQSAAGKRGRGKESVSHILWAHARTSPSTISRSMAQWSMWEEMAAQEEAAAQAAAAEAAATLGSRSAQSTDPSLDRMIDDHQSKLSCRNAEYVSSSSAPAPAHVILPSLYT